MIILTYIIDLLTNPIFQSTVASWACAQVIKYLLLRRKGKNFGQLMEGGGMPSSHTATVTGLATSTMIVCGTGGFEFVMALFFQIIVIFDAMGVRYQSGRMGKYLNHEVEKKKKQNPDDPFYRDVPVFKESMGHTLKEVIAGFFTGFIVAVIVTNLMRL